MRILRCISPTLPILLLSLVFAQSSAKQPSNLDDPQRREAMELFDNLKMAEAMPWLEQMSAKYPDDVVIKERWAFATLSYAATLTDTELRKKARIRGRKIALDAQKLGDNSPLLQTMLELPEDGSEPNFSERAEVDQAMKAAEADFSRGDLDKAREGYLRALLLDPQNYNAALFTGDVYFKQRIYGSAGEWFARAIQIDRNRETAYRYWGDALTAAGKNDEARAKFMEAIVAEPYSRSAWQGVAAWADKNGVKLNFVQLQDKSELKVKDDKNVEIT